MASRCFKSSSFEREPCDDRSALCVGWERGPCAARALFLSEKRRATCQEFRGGFFPSATPIKPRCPPSDPARARLAQSPTAVQMRRGDQPNTQSATYTSRWYHSLCACTTASICFVVVVRCPTLAASITGLPVELVADDEDGVAGCRTDLEVRYQLRGRSAGLFDGDGPSSQRTPLSELFFQAQRKMGERHIRNEQGFGQAIGPSE